MNDEAWFTDLFDRHYEQVGRFIQRQAPDLDVDNLTGEVFTRAWQKCRKIRKLDHPLAWLFKTARYLIANQLKKNQRRAALDGQFDLGFTARVTDDHAEEVVRSDRLRRALAGMSEKERTIVYLIAYHHYNPAEITQVLGSRQSTVRTWLYRLRNQIVTRDADEAIIEVLTELVQRRS